MSFQRFCGLTDSSSIPDRNTVWVFEQRLRDAGAERPKIQRKEPPLGVLSMREQARNQRIAKTRARWRLVSDHFMEAYARGVREGRS